MRAPKSSHRPAARALSFRQVHLDFHTSGLIAGIGRRFNKRQFQEALRRGHVDSVTLFSKCHHGWSYHPTKAGQVHPHLKFDLLGRQIEACQEIGVRFRLYLSAGVDERLAMNHPEWVVKRRDGSTYRPLEAVWFKHLRFNSPYLGVLCDQISEVVNRWPEAEGLFLDIISAQHDYSEPALREMQAVGLDPDIESDVERFSQSVLIRYHEQTNAAAQSGPNRNMSVFHNAGHVPVGAKRFIDFNGHLELESLPTGGWGYDHFLISARYAQTTGHDFLGMTGKFHTTWGEFGGFKRAAALRYECGAMLAHGAKCSIGDQLHPDAAMNADTYVLIGQAYAEVEAKEAWCSEVSSTAEIAVLSAEANQDAARSHLTASSADEGAARMLMELHLPFDVRDRRAQWKGYRLIVLPEGFQFDDRLLRQAQVYLAKGGCIIAAGDALLSKDRSRFELKIGARLIGRGRSDPDYLVATDLSPAVSVRTPIVIHGGCYEVEVTTAKVLAARRVSYFNRSWRHFCSHQHAPDSRERVGPAAILSGRIAYFGHNLFSRYAHYGQPLYRDFFAAALDRLISRRQVVTNLPTDARFNLLEQRAERRYIAHLLYAPKSHRGTTEIAGQGTIRPINIVEDLIPLRNVRVELRLPRQVRGARLIPQGEALDYQQKDGSLVFTVPEFTAHQMVELRY